MDIRSVLSKRSLRRSLVAAAYCVAGFAVVATDTQAATVTGRVRAGESVGPAKALSVAVDAWACALDGKTPDPSLVIGPERGLANVVVRFDVPGAAAAVADGDVLIDQKGCVFTPHVVMVAPGQTVRLRNSDRVLHNFRTITNHNRAVNKAQIGGKEESFAFGKPEIVRAACDVHYWMSVIIVVAPHRFVAVTDEAGGLRIDGLPAGRYRAELWHERLGTKTVVVAVSDEGGLLEVVWEAAVRGDDPGSTPKE